MKTKDGYIKLTSGYSWLFFLEEQREALGEALLNDKVLCMCKLAVLELSQEGACRKSKLPMVKSEEALRRYIKSEEAMTVLSTRENES